VRRFLVFAVKVIAFQMTTYFLAGMVAYPLLTKQFYVGPIPFLPSSCEPRRSRSSSVTRCVGSCPPSSCGDSLSPLCCIRSSTL
jgi:hypothetical protein